MPSGLIIFHILFTFFKAGFTFKILITQRIILQFYFSIVKFYVVLIPEFETIFWRNFDCYLFVDFEGQIVCLCVCVCVVLSSPRLDLYIDLWSCLGGENLWEWGHIGDVGWGLQSCLPVKKRGALLIHKTVGLQLKLINKII